MEFAPTAAMIALIIKVIDFVRYLKNGDINGVVTQLAVWIAGVVTVILVARTAWAPAISIGGRALSQLNIWSLIFAGLTVASFASIGKDTLKSIDNHNSSAIPTLLATGPRTVRRTKSDTNSEDVG
jgi:hypothetical protein